MEIPDDGHVVIIGGGPGGTACALALQRLAFGLGRDLRITLLEGKQFSGEHHYNQCVGVLSPPLPNLLEEKLDLPFPNHLCLVEIKGYVLHGARDEILLEGEEEASLAVRRVQFDAYMVEAVKNRGISVIPARAVDIELHQDYVVVYTENSSLIAHAIVGAFGMDEGSSAMFSRAVSYVPPRALDSIVTKYNPGTEYMESFGPFIQAFLPSQPQIEFSGITPKCSHLTINIAGSSVDSSSMQEFLHNLQIRGLLPDFEFGGAPERAYPAFFKGRFPRSSARNYYGDRYVMVGDAAGMVRTFKGKGVTTAVLTGIRAAETIMQTGVSKGAFHRQYRTANQELIADMPYGAIMRLVAINIARFGLLDTVIRAAEKAPTLRTALYDAVSAHAPYRDVLKRSLQPGSVWAVLTEISRHNKRSVQTS